MILTALGRKVTLAMLSGNVFSLSGFFGRSLIAFAALRVGT